MITDKTIELSHITARDGGARLRLHVQITEGGKAQNEVLLVFAARLSHMPKVGLLSEGDYEALVCEHHYSEALDVGLRLLGVGSASRGQFILKLCQRGVSREIATEVADDLWARGYGDEVAGALSVARRDLLKLWGDRRILLDVRAKGYDAAALEAVREMLQKEDAVARCTKLISKRYGTYPSDESARARFVAALVRYGYTPGEIRAALKDDR